MLDVNDVDQSVDYIVGELGLSISVKKDLCKNLIYLNKLSGDEYLFLIHRLKIGPVTFAEMGEGHLMRGCENIYVNEGTDIAFTHIGRIKNISMDYESEHLSPCIKFTFLDGTISHEYDLSRKHTPVTIPNKRFCKLEEISFDSIPNKINQNGVYFATGYTNVGGFLRRLGFEGEISENLDCLYDRMREQNTVIESVAKNYFFM